MVTAEDTLLSRGRIVIFLIGDFTAFVWATLGGKNLIMRKRKLIFVRAAFEQVKMVLVERLALNKSQNVYCPLQESSYNSKDKKTRQS